MKHRHTRQRIKKRKEEIDLRNQADSLVYSTEKQMNELGDKIPEQFKEKIKSAKERLEKAIKENEADMRPAMDALNQAWSEASTQMYQQAGPTGSSDAGTGQQSQGQSTSDKGNVEEADYTVVDDK